MKNYTITVNGNAYDVTVEEGTGSQTATTTTKVPVKAAPKAVGKPAQKSSGAQGGVTITASVPGKVFKIETSVGQTVKAGDNIVILEAMKMEIPVVAPQDGTVASIDVAVGDAVESGDTLASMN